MTGYENLLRQHPTASNIVRQEHLAPDDAVKHGPDLVYAGPRAYRAFKWEVEGYRAWEGRDWRRIKRERRRYMKAP